MTTESDSSRSVLLPILAVIAIGVGLRLFFVDGLTKLTGTWMGGVESPHRGPNPKGSSAT